MERDRVVYPRSLRISKCPGAKWVGRAIANILLLLPQPAPCQNPFFFTAGRGDTSSPLRTQSSLELVQFQDPSEDPTSAMQCCFFGIRPLCISGHLELSCSCNQLLEVLFSLRLGACQGQGQKSKMFARNSQVEGVILRQENNTYISGRQQNFNLDPNAFCNQFQDLHFQTFLCPDWELLRNTLTHSDLQM